jgi:RimJ/RimL family protein N-acetyltransferase
MKIEVRETKQFYINEARFRWLTDDDIDQYIGFGTNIELGKTYDLDSEKERHFELYEDEELIGDVRFIYSDVDDKAQRKAEFIIIIGKRNKGLGSIVFPYIIETVKELYDSIYCYVHKSNIRSVKLMKKNGFYVDEIKGSELLLVLDLRDD